MSSLATDPALRPRHLLAVLAVCLLSSPAASVVIDFETVPGVTPFEGMPVADQYWPTLGVRFGLDLDGDRLPDPGASPYLEQVGGASWSFIDDEDSSFDRPWPGTEAQLGDWFLGALLGAAGEALIVSYAAPVVQAGGQIWDIDGNPLQGTEQWRIEALDAQRTVLETILSPLGSDLSPAGGNAKPWAFAFDRPAQDIAALRIEFVGSKTWGLGFGFEGFAASPDPGPPVPEPGTALLVGLGLIGLARPRRRGAPG